MRFSLCSAAVLAGLGMFAAGCGRGNEAGLRREIDLSGKDWRLSLDRNAKWQDDELHLPPIDPATLPARPPTDGWDSLNEKNLAVAVPGTVEEYLWDEIGDYVGVSWWWRSFTPPADLAGKRVILKFEAARLRAEVFLNRKLVGYDAVGNTPFEIDVTGTITPGQANQLAIRVTDPSGNFDWMDPEVHKWGKQTIPASHGFGGVTGPVRLQIVGETYVDDIFVKNKPTMTEVDLDIAVRNTRAQEARHDLRVQILEAAGKGTVVFDKTWPGQTFKPGDQVVTQTVSVPKAKLWSPASPNLYVCRVTLWGADQVDQRFGFRWFAPDGVGQDAVFRLNGKRIVLRSAISWGFWPTNGIFPTPELAEKNVLAAKTLGLNMLNFHRCIGQPIVFDKADELGLLYFEEPGGYTSNGGDALCFALAREKLLRMVKRDRSRPSLIIYNMINEEQGVPGERHKKDMADAHRLDPTRTIVYTSGWAKDGDDAIKLHMRPYDDRQYIRGWCDIHNACGPGVYRDQFYQGPDKFLRHTDDRQEVVFWGEEGANAAPPRLELIDQELQHRPNGWDGKDYKEWYEAYRRYLDEKKLRDFFPTVDGLTRSLGNIQYYYQGRIIENIRAGNVTDGYVTNGWEDEKLENHSGLVDCFRNPKGDEELLAKKNGPLYVAVKLRNKIVQTPATVTADFFIVNEVDLKGDFNLAVSLCDPAGQTIWNSTYPVKVSGGETYGELLVSGVTIKVEGAPGRYGVAAYLDERPESRAAVPLWVPGFDELLVVDWKSQKLPERGAVLEENDTIRSFLKEQKGLDVPLFAEASGTLDYIVVGTCGTTPHAAIPPEQLFTPEGEPGLSGEYFKGTKFEESVLKRTDPKIDFTFGPEGPDAKVGGHHFSVRWQGKVRAPESGPYVFSTLSDDGVRLWVDGQLLLEQWNNHAERLDLGKPIELEAGKEYPIKLEYYQGGGEAALRLHWSLPSATRKAEDTLAEIFRRVRDDGTTAIFLDKANEWAGLLAKRSVVKYNGILDHGEFWLGGNFFVREHPLFADLPVNQGMNWEYQELTNYDRRRYGLLLEGEEAVVGSVTGHVHQVATAVGVVPLGKGRLVLSTLDILPVLNDPPGPADVVRKIFCNYLSYAKEKVSG